MGKIEIEIEPLIQQMKENYEFTQIKENPLRTYYTCVRYSNIPRYTSAWSGPHGTAMTYYGPGQWSCIKGWFEGYDDTFKNKNVDSKVLDYCKYRDTNEALKKELGESFIVFTPVLLKPNCLFK